MEKRVDVLDKGFVRMIDHLGGDSSIVRAARVSYGKGTKTPEEDTKLVKYLIRNNHTSPFEHVVFTFHIKCPIFVARQWMRHRTWSYNEISGRYAEVKDDFYVPQAWRTQDTKNKQGSIVPAEDSIPGREITRIYNNFVEQAYGEYLALLAHGVAKEMARMVLPVSLYTEFYATVDLHNLMHFVKLRTDEHAQWEIQQYAWVLLHLAEGVAPVAVKAFLEKIRPPSSGV